MCAIRYERYLVHVALHMARLQAEGGWTRGSMTAVLRAF